MNSNEDLSPTVLRRVLEMGARADGFSSVESVYRAVAPLRDLLPKEAKQQLVVMLEWAREGIASQNPDSNAELAALHAAYTYARDILNGSDGAAG